MQQWCSGVRSPPKPHSPASLNKSQMALLQKLYQKNVVLPRLMGCLIRSPLGTCRLHSFSFSLQYAAIHSTQQKLGRRQEFASSTEVKFGRQEGHHKDSGACRLFRDNREIKEQQAKRHRGQKRLCRDHKKLKVLPLRNHSIC